MTDPDATAADAAATDAPARGADGWPSDEAILEQGKRRFKDATDHWADWRQTAEDELKFAAGEQYPANVRRSREAQGRPVLTINRCPGFIRQITNEQRQNRPQIRFAPAQDGADEQAAETMTGLGRQIQVSSDADAAVDTAFEHAVQVGVGYFRMVTDYADDHGFAQEIRFRRVPNVLSIVFDPASREHDGSDCRYAFDTETMDKGLYARQYPRAGRQDDGTADDEFGDLPDADGWWDRDTVRVVEYYWLDHQPATIYLLSDGTVTDRKPAAEGVEPGHDPTAPPAPTPTPPTPPPTVRKTRKVLRPIVRWAKLTGSRVLEKTIVPGRWIPVFPVYGAELDLGGKVDRWGVVRLLKDAQIQHNAMQSALTERIQLSPKAPYLTPAEALAGHEAAWRDAATSNDLALPYNHVDEQGAPIPAPQRQQPIDLTQGLMHALAQSVDDMKAVTGIFDASLGNQGNEQSGRAILQRQKQSGTANFHFQDNLARAMRQAGRVMAAWIPLVFAPGQAVSILGPDGKAAFQQLGADVLNLPYEVVAEVGPSYNTRREQAAETARELVQAFPELMKVAGDLIVAQTDMPLADAMAARLRKLLPPALQDQPPSPIPPAVQQMVQRLEQALQVADQQNGELQSGVAIKREEIASRERIELYKAQSALEVEIARLGSKEGLTLLQEELKHLRERTDQLSQMATQVPPPQPDGAPTGGPPPAPDQTLDGPPGGGFSMPGSPQGMPPAGSSGTPASQAPVPSSSP